MYLYIQVYTTCLYLPTRTNIVTREGSQDGVVCIKPSRQKAAASWHATAPGAISAESWSPGFSVNSQLTWEILLVKSSQYFFSHVPKVFIYSIHFCDFLWFASCLLAMKILADPQYWTLQRPVMTSTLVTKVFTPPREIR